MRRAGRPSAWIGWRRPTALPHDAAHDAMGDTEATLYLCRLVRERAEGIWSNCVRFARKAAVLDYAQPGEVFAFVGFNYGRAYVRMVTAIGPNPERDSDLYVFDLSYDPHELAALNDDRLHKLLAASPKPVRRLRANAAPCILPYEDVSARAYACSCRVSRNSGGGPRMFGRMGIFDSG